MAARISLETIDHVRSRVPRDARRGMLADVLIFGTRAILEQVQGDLSLEQAMNVATLPGIIGPSLVMPDVHQGYGFPIGGVAALDYEHGVVSPGGVGFDINCGVRMVRTSLSADDARPRVHDLVNQVFRDIPCGTGGAGNIELSPKQLNQVLERGATWAVENGYGVESDLEYCEEGGCLEGADPADVSERARQRGAPQLGTVGSGNHFLEVQYVEAIHDADAARALNIAEGQVMILIHCGSRGLGHQVCTDYLARMGSAMKRYGISLPDRQLACVPISSPEGQAYLSAMRAAANFAWANRQTILHQLRESLRRLFGKQLQASLLYDVCHNIAKRERHVVEGKKVDVLVHRKGATRAFPPGHRDIPPLYRSTGQPVLIPGSMGTASWILAGAEGAMRESFGSVCHGAGRLMSRTAARKGRDARVELRKLENAGIIARSESRDGILEEIPDAYKDVDEVIEVVHRAGLARKVARLRPMGVIKG